MGNTKLCPVPKNTGKNSSSNDILTSPKSGVISSSYTEFNLGFRLSKKIQNSPYDLIGLVPSLPHIFKA